MTVYLTCAMCEGRGSIPHSRGPNGLARDREDAVRRNNAAQWLMLTCIKTSIISAPCPVCDGMGHLARERMT